MRAPGGVLAPLRERNFALLWSGMTVSLVGDGILLVALAWQVYELSNAPAALAVVGLAMTVPHVAFLLLGGVASDRFDRRRVMIASDAVRGLAVGVMGVLSVTGQLRLWQIFPIIAVYGGATAFFGPAFDAFVPDVVSRDQLTQANAIEQFVRPGAHGMAGPALGGLLIAVGGSGGAFLVDALTFVVSMACLARVRPRVVDASEAVEEDEGLPVTAGGVLDDVREGFRYVRANAWLWATLLAATFAYLLFTGPVDVLLPYLVKNDLKAGAGTLGLILAAGGVGAIGAALAVGSFGMPRRSMTFIYVAWTASTFVLIGYGLAAAAWQAMLSASCSTPWRRRALSCGSPPSSASCLATSSAGCRASTGSSPPGSCPCPSPSWPHWPPSSAPATPSCSPAAWAPPSPSPFSSSPASAASTSGASPKSRTPRSTPSHLM